MTHPARSTATGIFGRRFLSAAVVGLVVASPAGFAQIPATAGAPAQPAPLEAYTDPGWTGRPQPKSVLRKEAAAALVEGRRRCAREPNAQARRECLDIVRADHQLMVGQIQPRRAAR